MPTENFKNGLINCTNQSRASVSSVIPRDFNSARYCLYSLTRSDFPVFFFFQAEADAEVVGGVVGGGGGDKDLVGAFNCAEINCNYKELYTIKYVR